LSPEANLAKLKLEKTVNIAGFYVPTKKEKTDAEKLQSGGGYGQDSVVESIDKITLNESQNDADHETNQSQNSNADENNNDTNTSVDEQNEEEAEQSGEENSDDEGWIKPSNLAEVKKMMSIVEADQQQIHDLNIKVACMTSDFAMQVLEF
jgi:hypothetical protein